MRGTTTGRQADSEEKMALDWPCAAESTKQHYSPVPDLEPQGTRKREGKITPELAGDTDAELKLMGYT